MRHSASATIAFAVLLGLIGGGARAQDKDSCDGFKWSVAQERTAFGGELKRAASGATIAVGQAYRIALGPGDRVAFAAPPERAPKAGSFGAALGLAEIDRPGLYQITLSDEAWLDVVQGGAALKSVAFSGQKNCPGVRKSVRFDLKPGAATIQISNSAGAAINLAIEPAP
jgi:hypothetical protein